LAKTPVDYSIAMQRMISHFAERRPAPALNIIGHTVDSVVNVVLSWHYCTLSISVLCFGVGEPPVDPLDIQFVPSIDSYTSESENDSQQLSAVEHSEHLQVWQSSLHIHNQYVS